MKKTVVIHQPDFLPHLGFFHRLLDADLYVILDMVQYSKGGWINRDKIKTVQQREKWITVNIKKHPLGFTIRDIQLGNDISWKTEHLNLIKHNYKLTPFFNEIFPVLKDLYSEKVNTLLEFNLKSIEMLMKLFAIEIKMILASSLKPIGTKNHLLVDILKKVGGTHYLSGVGARSYFVPEPFQEAGVEVLWQDFVHPVYPQVHGNFVPYLSSIDLLFNCGIDESRKMIRSL